MVGRSVFFFKLFVNTMKKIWCLLNEYKSRWTKGTFFKWLPLWPQRKWWIIPFYWNILIRLWMQSRFCVCFFKFQPHLCVLVLVILFLFVNSSFILDSGMQNSVKRDKLLCIYNETIVFSQGVDRYGYTNQNKTKTENLRVEQISKQSRHPLCFSTMTISISFEDGKSISQFWAKMLDKISPFDQKQ